jgi:Ca2+-binding RTX toxin-like protein
MWGGEGKDTIAVNGSDDAEIFTATADNGRVRFERTYPNPFMLDIDAAETLALTTNGGDDVLLGGPGIDVLDGGTGNNILIQD